MDAMVDAIQDVVTAEPAVEVPQVSAQPDDAIVETRLAQEISTLWLDHARLSANRKATAKQLRQVRARLAERLYAMKSLLSHPGRGGEWRGWLREQGIPRSTADGLVARHAETLRADDQNVPTRAIKQSQDTVEQLVQSLLPRLRRKLPDARALFRFIAALAEAFGLASVDSEDCIWVCEPGPEEDEDSSAPDAPEAASTERTISPGTGVPSRNAVAP